MTPANEQAASVCSVPPLNRNTAIIAAVVSAKAQRLTLATSGASNERLYPCTRQVARNTVWIANQIARLRITPTTAAVIADKAPPRALLPRSCSMNGAPRKIQRKHGVNVTHVA